VRRRYRSQNGGKYDQDQQGFAGSQFSDARGALMLGEHRGS